MKSIWTHPLLLAAFLLHSPDDSVVSAQTKQTGLPNCMYCKRMDETSSFMYSYSYCADLDECLADAWNYYNKACPSGW